MHEEVVVSYYFFEFPTNRKAREFYDMFDCIGNIVEVLIAPRLNTFEKKFGFVRFKNEEDSRLLGVNLDNMQFDVKKIHANLPRFER